ncbi:putative ribonuclease H-like domain-containing protein [Tanacetum coccineum]
MVTMAGSMYQQMNLHHSLETFKLSSKEHDTKREKDNKAKLEIKGYEIALESLESRIIGHEKNELAWEKAVKERDELKDKIAKWEESTKNIEEILNSQMSDRDKTGLGYSTQLNELSSNHETDSENSLSIFDGRSSDDEHIPENDRLLKNGYKVIPLPITWNFLTQRADISFAGLDEYVIRNKIIESQITELNNKTSEIAGVLTRTGFISTAWPSISTARPSVNTARPASTARPSLLHQKPCFRPKDLKQDVKTFEVKNMTTTGKRAVVNTGKSKLNTDLKKSRWVWRPKGNYLDHVSKDSGSFMLKKGNPEILLQDHAVVDSGCSSHMTGNKAYLSDYEDFNGGFMAFGSDPKGDELKFNLFSVSQMCDKKNSVLFTESECLILSPSFKLLDESQVVLRAPRKDDVYSLDLKNIVPSRGKSPSISFMRPFGCPLTILNTLDSLGKFDGKSDEGYLLGYSTSSKAFREYILLPLQPHRIRIPVKDVVQIAQEKPSENASSDKDVQDSEDAADKEEQHQMQDNEKDFQDKLEMLVTQELVAKATEDVSRQAFEEEKRRIASQKKAAQATNTNQLSTDRLFLLKKEVYVHQPSRLCLLMLKPNKVYKVIKALYGLHQAPRAWYETLSSFLMENGFRRGTIDKTLFIKRTKSDIIFQMSSMGELTFFLGLQVKQLPEGIFISQDKYVADILKKFDFLSIRAATTPIESNKPLVKDEDGVDKM